MAGSGRRRFFPAFASIPLRVFDNWHRVAALVYTVVLWRPITPSMPDSTAQCLGHALLKANFIFGFADSYCFSALSLKGRVLSCRRSDTQKPRLKPGFKRCRLVWRVKVRPRSGTRTLHRGYHTIRAYSHHTFTGALCERPPVENFGVHEGGVGLKVVRLCIRSMPHQGSPSMCRSHRGLVLSSSRFRA